MRDRAVTIDPNTDAIMHEQLATRTGIRALSRLLEREDMYDPISGVTISIWSEASARSAIAGRWPH